MITKNACGSHAAGGVGHRSGSLGGGFFHVASRANLIADEIAAGRKWLGGPPAGAFDARVSSHGNFNFVGLSGRGKLLLAALCTGPRAQNAKQEKHAGR
jgi:hypothetical protein